MISLQLVLGSPVLRAQVEALEMGAVCRYTKRNTNKTAQVGWRIRRSITAQVYFNGAILKVASWNDSESASIIHCRWSGVGDAHSATA
jgi:hypothetical protein